MDAGHHAQSSEFPIAIIGAGFSGIGMAIKLLEAGIDSFTIFERADEIGGTWRDNTYPGCACDVPSHVYSYSFEPNASWSRMFSGSAEIQEYLLRVVDKYGLRPYLRLNTEIVDAAFDEDAGLWRLATAGGESVTARAVVSGVGGLVDPAYPAIDGLDEFSGALFHTARWDHSIDLEGKNVAIVGTGASALQVVPSIAERVGRLSVYQRTPSWVMPKRDHAIDAATQERFGRHPALQRAARWFLYAMSEAMGPLIFMDTSLSKLAEKASLKHLERSVSDPALRAKLTPDFQFGCKRMLVSDDYWSTFMRDNVELVTQPVAKLTQSGVVTGDGEERPADVVALATGFKLGLASAPFPIRGLGGRDLTQTWERGAVAYKGMTVAGFPNWFILMGPNTGPGHTSVLMFTEAQMNYALQGIDNLRKRDLRYLTVKQSVQDRYNDGIQKRMKHMVWSSGCNSWYLNPNGENHALYPGFASEYRTRVRRFKLAEYDVVS